MIDKRILLSTLWVFAVLNYLYCDVMGLMDANLLKQFLTGTVNGMHMSQGFFLGAALLMEISIVMVLLSRILPHKVNRVANVIAGFITTAVQIGTLFGTPTLYYIFFSVIEIGATVAIFTIALRWRQQDERA